MEGTLLGWADSLLDFAYGFIHNFIAEKKPAEPPFNIPLLRFVKVAIAYPEKSLVGAAGTSSGTSHRAAYLLEELLQVDRPFIKYIHNAEAVPLQDTNEAGHDIGVFLCFIQHVQFVHTHGQAYISDFQGTLHSLTLGLTFQVTEIISRSRRPIDRSTSNDRSVSLSLHESSS
jgi:hypothetical protein